jgi:hypothetical protein
MSHTTVNRLVHGADISVLKIIMGDKDADDTLMRKVDV